MLQLKTEREKFIGIVRTCRRCGKMKWLHEFPNKSSMKRGIDIYCRDCRQEIYHEWYSRNRERKRRTRKEWNKRQGGQVAVTSRYDRKYPERRRAYNLVLDALRSGELVKPDCCSHCGEYIRPRDLHAHHHDYKKPLDVTWLCQRCHHKLHQEIRRKQCKSLTN